MKEGVAVVDDVFETYAPNIDRFHDAELHRLRAEMLGALGDTRRAGDAFAAGLAVARAQGALWLELRLLLSQWRSCAAADRGFVGDALRVLYGRLVEGFETRAVRAASQILARSAS